MGLGLKTEKPRTNLFDFAMGLATSVLQLDKGVEYT